jgi:hypothetical protein
MDNNELANRCRNEGVHEKLLARKQLLKLVDQIDRA